MTTEIHSMTVREAKLAEIAQANHEAKRQQTIVNVPLHDPSEWDQHHDWLDVLIDEVREVTP